MIRKIGIKPHTRYIAGQPRRDLPKYLIYHNPKDYSYKLFSTKNGELLGDMDAYPEFVFDDRNYYPKERGYTSFFISHLKAFKKKQGVGRAFIDLAKIESIRRNCEGKIHLLAKNITGDPDNIPIIFYRKLGFDSQYRGLIRNIDEFLKGNTKLSKMVDRSIPMYMPADKTRLSK